MEQESEPAHTEEVARPTPPPRPLAQRIVLGAVLLGYLAFAGWAFFWNHDVGRALTWFLPISLLLWLVLRAVRRR